MRAMAEIALDTNEKAQSRVAAGALVLNYAHGKPDSDPDTVKIEGSEQKTDFSKLTPEDQATMFELVKKARG